MTPRLLPALAACAFALTIGFARAGADEDWADVVKLDAGPQSQPASREEAVRLARAHLAKHQAAIAGFLRTYPDDPRVFDARLRLATIKAAIGNMDQKPPVIAEALRDMMALEKSAAVPAQKQADASFQRISLQMQTMTGRDEEIREAIVTAARNFAARFPSDKRSPRLLVEAATQCDEVPDTMRNLLFRARELSREPALDARIADDLRRMDALGKPVDANFKTIQGGTIDTATLRGSVVVLVFWAAESPHSLIWLKEFRDAVRKIPAKDLQIVTISLDEERKNLDEAMRAYEITWPTNFDGKGWENEVARPLGINALPTVWVLDKRGKLRVLNARESYDTWIRKLQRELR